MDFGRLQATAIIRKNSIAFVEQMFTLYAARRPLVLVSDSAQADQLPGIDIDRCIDPASQTGWITTQHPVILDDLPAQVSYTSGTEGLPKGILLTYRNLGYTTERIIDVMQMTAEVRESASGWRATGRSARLAVRPTCPRAVSIRWNWPAC